MESTELAAVAERLRRVETRARWFTAAALVF